MKFTIVSHACMYVEGDGGSILVDPWFLGTCYWRSWWNFPEPTPELIGSLKPQSIYITHLHWDHFHGPSLRRFKPDIRIYVPKIPTDRMVRDLAAMGYRNVVEIPHGGHREIWPGCRLHSYQFGAVFSDSAAVISDGRTTIVDLNDCKLFGFPLRQLTRDFPKIDFVLRSHSSASPLPYCVQDYKERFPELRSQQNYIDEFINCGLSVGARYAIPFASNHCFVHRETVQYNDTVVNPAMIEAPYNARADEVGVASRCVVMTPGSSWSDRDGFSIQPFDYAAKDAYLAQLLQRYSGTLERQYAKEDRAKASFQAFEKYFTRLIEATPWVLRRLMPTVLFKVTDCEGRKLFLVDFGQKRVAEVGEPVAADFAIDVHALVLNDCVRKRMFSSWSAAKRLRFEVPPSEHSLSKIGRLLTLLDYFENDGLPLRRNLSPRQLGVRLRRWREVAEACRLALRHKVLRKPFVISELYPVAAPAGRTA
jgi:UDP-MurNAc hydroxylase